MQVRISTQPTRLTTTTQPASLDQRSQRAQVQVRTTEAQADIQQRTGRLRIDSYACRAARGLKNSADVTRDISQKGLLAVQETVSQYVQGGNRLAQISSPANSIAQLVANRNAGQMQPLSIAWGSLPLPDISYEMTPTRTDWSTAQIDYQVQPAQLQGSYTPGAVDTRVAQYASIDIQVAGTGNNVNVQT